MKRLLAVAALLSAAGLSTVAAIAADTIRNDQVTVAVFSDADKDSLAVDYADEAVHIGPSPAGKSYLNIEYFLHQERTSDDNNQHSSTAALPHAVEYHDHPVNSRPGAGYVIGVLSCSDQRWQEHPHR